ncbi:ABC transporter permease [Thiobacter aerophilum]|uniref:ABC transporter permease n=1 Tax=Thiobacter aerophilum TaxID=3121275 RepID=A0ABV0EFU9_9BURK
MSQVLAIARYTALEALRARSLRWALFTLCALFAASLFLRELTLTDSQRLQTTFLAAASRLACAVIVATLIIGAVVREFNEEGHLLLLSLPLPRTRYVLGRFLGFVAVALALALASASLLALTAPPALVLGWTVGLYLELSLVSAMAVFAAFGLRQWLPALLATLGFYLLARSIGGLQLLAHASRGDSAWLAPMTDVLAWLMPRLDGFASSARLLGETGGLAAALVQTLLYCALLLTAAALDVSRRDL